MQSLHLHTYLNLFLASCNCCQRNQRCWIQPQPQHQHHHHRPPERTLLRTSLSASFAASHFRRIAPLVRPPSPLPLVFSPIPRYSASGCPKVPPSSIQSQACIAPSVALTGLPGALRLTKLGPWLPKSYMSHTSQGFTFVLILHIGTPYTSQPHSSARIACPCVKPA